PEAEKLLRQLGAAHILTRQEAIDTSTRPMLTSRWAGAVDTVGGSMLSAVLRSLVPLGTATACGLVGGADLTITVYPFLLRGVRLIGIDSVNCAMPKR